VAWCLKESASYGFDMLTYEGTGAAHTESHNLGAVPEMITVKNVDATDGWITYHYAAINKSTPETDYGRLDVVSGVQWTDFNMWNDTAPTSTVFSVSTYAAVNTLNETYMAYLWRSIPGVSKVWHFDGNGNANGPVVYCGFRPRWVIFRASEQQTSWYVYDALRDTYNQTENYLVVDTPAAETTNANYKIDITANGFKARGTASGFNANNVTHIGLAFADQPFNYSNAR
jgi:hypothetical protein